MSHGCGVCADASTLSVREGHVPICAVRMRCMSITDRTAKSPPLSRFPTAYCKRPVNVPESPTRWQLQRCFSRRPAERMIGSATKLHLE